MIERQGGVPVGYLYMGEQPYRGAMKYGTLAGIMLATIFATTASAESQEPERRPVPAEIIDPPWLASREHAQLEAAKGFEVFWGFGFSDQIARSGISFRNRSLDDSGKTHIPVHYDHGNGIAVADVNGDGLGDIYFPNQVGGNQLWKNQGGIRFTNITSSTVALEKEVSVSASFADIDNDGDADLYVTAVRSGNHLFTNDGSGAFEDRSASSGLGHKGHSSGAVFFDYNRDGQLDLFLANVGVYTSDVRVPVSPVPGRPEAGYEYYRGLEDAFSGHLIPERAEQSLLFENSGDGRFVDVSEVRRLVDTGWTGDACPLDANEDGWPDLYVLNMQGSDEYYENVAGQYFTRKTPQVFPKTPWGSMGVEVFDFDNDGHMDLFVTDMHSDMSEDIGPEREKLKALMDHPEDFLRTRGASIFGNALFRSEGADHFTEMSDQLGVETYWPWGVCAGDLNADGYEDLFVTASMNFPFRYGVNSVLLNDRGRRFLDSEFVLGVEPRRGGRTAQPWFELDCLGTDRAHLVCQERGADMTPGRRRERVVAWGALGSRSAVIFDLDGDGDLDIVTNDFNSEPMVLVSDLTARKPEMRFLKVELIGTLSNRSGFGARVSVHAGARSYTKVRDGKSGYLSQSLYPLYFGLGQADRVDRIEVQWPSGTKQVVPGPIATNTLIEVEEPRVPSHR